MKQILLMLLIFCWLLPAGCKKKKHEADPPYVANPDLQGARDISLATGIVTDIDMMCSFLMDGQSQANLYAPAGGSQGGITLTHDTYNKFASLIYNITLCKDGKLRSGGISLDYKYDPVSNPNAGLNAVHYYDRSFAAKLSFSNYTVDGWKIELADAGQPAHLINIITSDPLDPHAVNPNWEIAGKLKLSNSLSGKEIIWEGALIKTLANVADSAVYSEGRQPAVNWSLARLSYSGTVSGSIASLAYTATIDPNNRLLRDFTCHFIPPHSVNTQLHPMISGSTRFLYSNYYPRTINYGPQQDCDNSGTVSFQEEVHALDFD